MLLFVSVSSEMREDEMIWDVCVSRCMCPVSSQSLWWSITSFVVSYSGPLGGRGAHWARPVSERVRRRYQAHQQTPADTTTGKECGSQSSVVGQCWHNKIPHHQTPHHSSGLVWGVCLPVIWRCWLTWELNFRGRNWLPAMSQQLSYLTFLPTVCLVARSCGRVWWSVSVSVRAWNLIHVTGLQSLPLNATFFLSQLFLDSICPLTLWYI